MGGAVGRFQVMALLQAARYYVLTGDLERAKSFGLNRAIFYAWAKRYGRGRPPAAGPARLGGGVVEVEREGKRVVYVGNEAAQVSPSGWFTIGGREQLPEDYDRQVARRIGSVVPYERAWRAAVEYVKSFSRGVLLDQQRFYEMVYKPVRDRFTDLVEGRLRRGGLDEFLR